MSAVRQDERKGRVGNGRITDGIVEGLPRLFVPNKRGLSLVGHSDRCTHSKGLTLLMK